MILVLDIISTNFTGGNSMNIEKLCNEYRENKRMIEELEAINEQLKADIVAAMGDNEIMIAGASKISNITVNSTRFDSATFKKKYPDLFTAYSKATAYKRFSIV